MEVTREMRSMLYAMGSVVLLLFIIVGAVVWRMLEQRSREAEAKAREDDGASHQLP
jgi:hypothetical protein